MNKQSPVTPKSLPFFASSISYVQVILWQVVADSTTWKSTQYVSLPGMWKNMLLHFLWSMEIEISQLPCQKETLTTDFTSRTAHFHYLVWTCQKKKSLWDSQYIWLLSFWLPHSGRSMVIFKSRTPVCGAK